MRKRSFSLILFAIMLALMGGLIAVACGGETAPAPAAPQAPQAPAAAAKAAEAAKPAEAAAAAEAEEAEAAAEAAEGGKAAPAVKAAADTTAEATPVPAATVQPVKVAGEPKYGGVLRDPTYAVIAKWDMTQDSPNSHMTLLQRHYNGILQFSFKDLTTVLPDLAKSWSVSDDGKVYTFEFREGVTYSDGTPFSVDDAIWTMERWMDPPAGTALPRAGGYRFMIEKVEKSGPNSMDVTVIGSQPLFIKEVANGWHIVLPRHIAKDMDGGIDSCERVIGTGPYVIDCSVSSKDNYVSSTRNPNYFKTDTNFFDPSAAGGNQLPFLDGVTTYVMNDPNAVEAAFRTFKIDMSDNQGVSCCNAIVSQAMIKEFKGKVSGNPGLSFHRYFDFNHTQAPFNDIRARRAVHLAMDRKKASELGDKFYLASGFFDPIFGANEAELNTWPGYSSPTSDADLAEAKRLAQEVGLTEFSFLAPTNFTWGTQMPQLYSQDMAAIGVTMTLETMDFGSMLTRASQGDYDVAFGATGISYLDPGASVALIYGPTGGRNFGKWNNPEGTEAPQEWTDLFNAQITQSGQERKDTILKMEHIMRDEWLPVAPMDFAAPWQIWWSYVKNYKWLPILHHNYLRNEMTFIDKDGF